MKTLSLLVIVLIAIAIIFSISAVSADKPTDLPVYDEPICDVCGKLNTLIDAGTSLTTIQSDLNDFRADVEDNFTHVSKIVSRSGTLYVDDTNYQLHVVSSEPFKLTISIGGNIEPDEVFRILYVVGDSPQLPDFCNLTGAENFRIQTFEVVCEEFALYADPLDTDMLIYYSYIITYSGEEPEIL